LAEEGAIARQTAALSVFFNLKCEILLGEKTNGNHNGCYYYLGYYRVYMKEKHQQV